ncbi:structural maintenance of chromosome 2 [Nematocida major]|uniref:structural maintenance of chromosome 2 n=1 Tax=Nematocida major TaxID=1912982 RepID=UPI002007B659|nr:structural maintenance of chromosome 2 [Nematocida major]KAH9386653.1 structural maintenance of chromosome 2 [Nematocida major]
MYLESLEVEGFKSYGDRTVIGPLDKSFTAITGLNGTGKSNILDAICFVLGVDTPRLLRSGSMRDLIFKQKKGTSGSAKVSLLFCNKEKDKGPAGYEEIDTIKITRIITEEGRTKYLLNDHSASTKTVTRLLQCVGLSSSKGYAGESSRVEKQVPYYIVMQGRVSKILSMRSSQFLSVLEECSGTSTYKTEKCKAHSVLEKKERKLLETKETLGRTIFPFMERLRQERDEYYLFKETEARRASAEKEALECAVEIEHREEEAHEEMKKQLLRRNAEIEQEISEMVQKMEGTALLDVDIAGIQEVIDAKKREISGLMIEVQEEEIRHIGEAISGVERDVKHVLAEYTDVERRLQVPEEKASAQASAKAFVKNGENLGREKSLQEVSEEESLIRARMEEVLVLMEAREKALLDAGRHKSILDVERRKEALSVQIEGLQRSLSRTENALEEARRRGISEEEAARNVKMHADCRGDTASDLRREIERAKREVGYPVQSGVFGKVKELVRIKAPEDEVPVGTVIGARREYIIVQDENVAKKVIEELSREGRRVDVIPLSKIVSRRIDPRKEEAARKHRSIPLMEAVQYPAEIKKAVEYLLGGFILSPDRKTSVKLRDGEGITTVTREGEIFDKRGTVTGGSPEGGIKYSGGSCEARTRLCDLQRRDEALRLALRECPISRLQESERCVKAFAEREALKKELAEAQAELAVLEESGTPQERRDLQALEEIGGIKARFDSLANSRKSLQERRVQAERALKVAREREETLSEEISREETHKLEGIRSNEVNTARRSIQMKERRSLQRAIDEISQEMRNNEVKIKKERKPVKYAQRRSARSEIRRASLEELQERARALKKELAEMQAIPRRDVNHVHMETLQRNDAVEEALRERIQKVQSNKESIEKSLGQLNSMEKETVEGIFRQVNSRIGKYMRYFIPESDARLEAVDGSVMKGVEMHVKIGTWKKGLTELSGGQRSICALSLIFALLRTRPSPLYILDEIDAALDASHTEAMGRMVQKEFGGSQFIVVSLKDGMYHNANVLFQTFIREGTSGVRRM